MRRYRGKELRVEQFQGVLTSRWFAIVTDPGTGKDVEGGLHLFKFVAWVDAYRIARG